MFSFLLFAGYAFVYFEDERDAEDAIRGIDNIPFGYEKRKLSVEWAKVFIYPSFSFLMTCMLCLFFRESSI